MGEAEEIDLVEAQKKPTLDDVEPVMPIGPMTLPRTELGRIIYGGALRPGEGDATALYAIEKLQSLGYVMSASRNVRMDAIRVRKENQVFSSAEDKWALTMFNDDEKVKLQMFREASSLTSYMRNPTTPQLSPGMYKRCGDLGMMIAYAKRNRISIQRKKIGEESDRQRPTMRGDMDADHMQIFCASITVAFIFWQWFLVRTNHFNLCQLKWE
ncbi:unnamed protein product [Dovyalis caffra]|uniref:NF-kappa-B-activating protein C-terminal domain-containing protein n=1 Tax=Dovyalis caffra TaxID=77055 RepID=A0AAV1QQ79_9ROSI|nr:unnamed protein product [Dovyalis caffra]